MTRKYKTSYKSRRVAKRFHVEIVPPPANPLTEEQKLRENIAKEKKFIKTYPNYPPLCEEARVRLKFYRVRLARLLEEQKQDVIYNKIDTLLGPEGATQKDMERVAEQFMEGGEPNPFISGGEIVYPQAASSSVSDDAIPF